MAAYDMLFVNQLKASIVNSSVAPLSEPAMFYDFL